jgi:glutathione peroxidase
MHRFLAATCLMAMLLTAPLARAGDAFGHAFTAIEGHPLPLEAFRGRPMLVVNTASFCAFTRQYEALQALWDDYRDRGLVVLGVPSDDFNQELDENGAIREFCEVNFGIDFPMTERVKVRGSDSHPLFVEFREQLGDSAGPSWNFFKYLVAPDGRVVEAWSSRIEPDDAQIIEAIEALLQTS